VPPRDVKALASALSYLMTHDELRKHMGRAALERAQANSASIACSTAWKRVRARAGRR
jgi:glycosyltransferase involved in cell wall biosynthesis